MTYSSHFREDQRLSIADGGITSARRHPYESTAAANKRRVRAERPCYANPDPWDLDVIYSRASALDAAQQAVALCGRCPFVTECREDAIQRARREDPPRAVIQGGIVWSQKGQPLNANMVMGLSRSRAARKARGSLKSDRGSSQPAERTQPTTQPLAS